MTTGSKLIGVSPVEMLSLGCTTVRGLRVLQEADTWITFYVNPQSTTPSLSLSLRIAAVRTGVTRDNMFFLRKAALVLWPLQGGLVAVASLPFRYADSRTSFIFVHLYPTYPVFWLYIEYLFVRAPIH